MDFKDYYKLLGVSQQASAKEIKSAYRALARKHHPDVNPGNNNAEKAFAEINEAYEVLSNDEERKKFDEIADYVKAHGHPPQPGGGQQRQANPNVDFGDLDPSFFDQFFGGGRQRRSATPRRGADLHAEIDVTMAEAMQGSLRTLQIERQEPCRQCGGTGVHGQSVCPVCRGRGEVIVPQSLEVKIPAGVTEGSTVRIPGQGEGNPRGDLMMKIRLLPDPLYRVEGHDLYRELEVPVFTAMLGGEVGFEGLRGKLSLKLPAETQNGRTFRLKGQGLNRAGDKPAGELYVKISLRIPTGLSEEQRNQVRQLRDHVSPAGAQART
jgi:molecular chaperone DnaJ